MIYVSSLVKTKHIIWYFISKRNLSNQTSFFLKQIIHEIFKISIFEFLYLLMEKFDVIVVGLGWVGLATTYYCSKQGLKVLGFEMNGTSGEIGTSSHGTTRIYRFNDANPIKNEMMKVSYTIWKQAEKELEDLSKIFYKYIMIYLIILIKLSKLANFIINNNFWCNYWIRLDFTFLQLLVVYESMLSLSLFIIYKL